MNIRLFFYGVMTSSRDHLKSMYTRNVFDTICETISMRYDYELLFDSCTRECGDRDETICISTLSTIKTCKKTLHDSIPLITLGIPEFNSSAALANTQLGRVLSAGILI